MSFSLSPILFKVARPNRLKLLKKMEELQWLSSEEIKKSQFRKLKGLLDHAYENVPYYREKFRELGLTPNHIESLQDFMDFPLLSKENIIEDKSRIVARNSRKRDLLSSSTSGSTGVNFQFYKDKRPIEYIQAINLRQYRWAGWDIGDKHVQLWGSHYDLSKAKSFYKNLKHSFIHKTLFLSSYDMTVENMQVYREKINEYKPSLISGYASALFLFSEFLASQNLDIHSPAGMIASAETLYESQRKLIESVFKCKVFNRYGCREVGIVAQECKERNGLHIVAEHSLVEVLDESGYPSEPGKIGKIVITDLVDYAFPLIRYQIDDIGILSDRKCSCSRGLPLLERVEGRVFDIIVGTNGNHLTGTFWTILLREYAKGILQFQILQERFGEIIMRLVVNHLFTENEKQKLLKRVYLKCGADIKIEVQLVDNIPLTNSGKHRFVISKVSPFI